MRAFVLDHDGRRRLIDTSHVVAASMDAPVVLEGALVELGFLDRYRELYLRGIAAVSSDSVANEVRRRGLERLHDHLDADQVVALMAHLGGPTLELSVPVSRALMEVGTAPPRPHYFICARTFVRVMIPYRVAQRSSTVMQAGHLFGHVLPAEPHTDFELSHARNSRSLWSAIGPVCAGNSVTLFDGTHDAPGPPLCPELAPGDTLVFNSDTLHGSVRNETDETRVAIGNRVAIGRRLEFGPGTHWRPWYDASLLDTPLAPLATLQSRLSTAAWRRWRWRRRWDREQQALASTPGP